LWNKLKSSILVSLKANPKEEENKLTKEDLIELEMQPEKD